SASIGVPGRAPYSASKAAIVALTRALAVEWAGGGVCVNAVARGYVGTPMIEQAMTEGLLSAEGLAAPAGRVATAEIAAAVVFLVSPEAGLVTGETLTLDGGYLAYGTRAAASRLPEMSFLYVGETDVSPTGPLPFSQTR